MIDFLAEHWAWHLGFWALVIVAVFALVGLTQAEYRASSRDRGQEGESQYPTIWFDHEDGDAQRTSRYPRLVSS